MTFLFYVDQTPGSRSSPINTWSPEIDHCQTGNDGSVVAEILSTMSGGFSLYKLIDLLGMVQFSALKQLQL